MNEPTTYEIVIRGRASARFLRPLIDDWSVDHTAAGTTRLVGEVRDAAHLHGVLAHLTGVSSELISVAPFTPATPAGTAISSTPIPAPHTPTAHTPADTETSTPA